MRNIAVSDKTWRELKEIKDNEELTHFADVIKLLITEREVSKNNSEESIKHQPSIRSQVLHLMNDGNTWQLADLVTEVSKNVKQDSDTIKRFIESILDTVPEITKVGDARYRLPSKMQHLSQNISR